MGRNQDKDKNSQNRGANTNDLDTFEDGVFQQEIRNVIELMGPDTSLSQLETITQDKNKGKKNKSSPTTTPRDVSDITSFATDSVEVYVDPRPCLCEPDLAIKKNKEYQNIKLVKDAGTGPLSRISSFFKTKGAKEDKPLDLYKINIIQTLDDNSPPRRVIFDRLEELPRNPCNNAATSTSILLADLVPKKAAASPRSYNQCNKSGMNDCNRNQQYCHRNRPFHRNPFHRSVSSILVKHNIIDKNGISQKQTFYGNKDTMDDLKDNNDISRVDVYYFDHGNAAYYNTTDSPPLITTEILAEKTENYTIKFWAELFGTVHIGFSFFTSFILQLFRFILQSIIRPLTIGLIQLASDYCFKPLLATLFNAVIQPPLILIYNIATSLRDICDPVAEGIGYFIREIAVLFASIRCFEKRKQINCKCCNDNCSVKEDGGANSCTRNEELDDCSCRSKIEVI